MDDCSPTNSYPTHHHHQRQSFHVVLPSQHSSEAGYLSTQPALPLQQYGSRGDESNLCFSALGSSSQGREESNGGERGLLNTGESSLERDGNLGGHLEGEERHFESWYGNVQKEDWDESCQSPTDNFYGKGNCYRNTNDFVHSDRAGHRAKANYNSFMHVNDINYNRKGSSSYVTKQSTFCREAEADFSDTSPDYCRTDSVLSECHLGEFEPSSEDQLQPAEVEPSPWLTVSQTGENQWRGGSRALTSNVPPQKSPVGLNSRTYTQKLDSFSDAFLSQAKRRFPVITTGDSYGQIWDLGVKSRLSCSFDSDSSSPSLPSFPSPPTSNLLSPPPTPLPPASQSPSKMDSPGAIPAGVHSASQGGENHGPLQFFPIRSPSLHPPNSSGIMWNLPLLPHCFPQLSSESSSTAANPRSSIGSNSGNSGGPHDIVQSPELGPSSSQIPVFHSSKALCFSNSPSIHSFFPPTSNPALISGLQNAAGENIFPLIHKLRQGPPSLRTSQLQKPACPIYTAMPFPSKLQSKRGVKRAHYTPRPLLNPLRKGTGLYSSVCHKDEESVCGEEEEECGILPCINLGPHFQADIPSCTFGKEEEEEEVPREQLLWKPWDELTDSTVLQDQVEKLLSMSSSSCLPGGGSNTELALHCLHVCRGNIIATLEMLLFSQPTPSGDYHYPGTAVWTDNEKSLFSAALETCGKDFSLIQIMVKTKMVAQCVEFYYLSKKLEDKRKTRKEEECKVEEVEQPKNATPIPQPVARQMRLEEVVPIPSLASFFPCKLCGKMFYKIKSRNAHMKIHRQPQEDWTDRKLQQQILNQTLNRASSLIVPPQTQSLAFGGTNNATHTSVINSNSINLSNASVLDHSALVTYSNSSTHVISNIDAGDPSSRETSVLQFQPIWGSFGHTTDTSSFYCNTDVKTETEVNMNTAKWK